MSIHTGRTYDKLAREGKTFTGTLTYEQFADLAELSKGDLIEVALRLAGSVIGDPDTPAAGYDRVVEEHKCLQRNGILPKRNRYG